MDALESQGHYRILLERSDLDLLAVPSRVDRTLGIDISLQRCYRVLTPRASFLIWRVLGSAPVRTYVVYRVPHYFSSVSGVSLVAAASGLLTIYSYDLLIYTRP